MGRQSDPGSVGQYCFRCVPAECDGTFGRNEPLGALKPAEITEKIQKISAFGGPQCVSGSMGESSQEFTTHRRLGAKQTVLGGSAGAGSTFRPASHVRPCAGGSPQPTLAPP